MQSRLAFTARFWGDSAVVCRALENHPGPAVVQEFGSFRPWTQAHAFATRLNEGLDHDHSGARQIMASSELLASDLLRTAVSPARPSCLAFARVGGKPLRVQFIL